MLDGILQTVLLSVEQLMQSEIESCFGQQKSGLYFYKPFIANIYLLLKSCFVCFGCRLLHRWPSILHPVFQPCDVCLA